MNKGCFFDHLHECHFAELFNAAGWDNPTTKAALTVKVGDKTYTLQEVAQKHVKVYACEVDAFPPVSIRRTLDAKIRKYSHQHFVIFFLKDDHTHQQWFVPVETVDKRRIVVAEYNDDTHAAPLYDKLNGITFGLEEQPAVLDVMARINAQFVQNSQKITQNFFKEFNKKHQEFVKGIEGIADVEERNWFASVMLNRLMFCYFIQKKGFFMDADGNPDVNYLRNKLQEVIRKKGDNQFYGTFYKNFLRELFEEGLNKATENRSKSFKNKYGLIPYLNGGMFETHQLEAKYPNVDVPDEVFSKLFDFFDEWNWHLDDRLDRDGRDINPDVLGYIFEKYINDRAQMGAYYTKEDITEYIGRNCIIPYLFGAVAKTYPAPFQNNGFVWQTLKNSKDAYIYDAVKKGLDLALPDYIQQGIDTAMPDLRKRRERWNEKADEVYALPTEIWRETVARRQRYAEIFSKIQNGEITDIHDFITYNLKIRDFVEDLIRNTDDACFVRHFYEALRNITILDPTCGSGAFLFAALNILEPLYEACLDRMEEPQFKDDFKENLAEIQDKYRANRQYFIYKSIILRNLYGVDIMHEATEIARLRLFLKMVAVVEANPTAQNLGLDPLPDIDFNIRCGNTLVGYASQDHLEKSLKNSEMALFAQGELDKVNRLAADISKSCARFRKEQLAGNTNLYAAKTELKKKIAKLGDQLDRTLAKTDYGIDTSSENPKADRDFQAWKENTQPFHWYSEFYNIIAEHGGFDVIIGNPPYVEYKRKNKDTNLAICDIYKVGGLITLPTSNLYAFTIERVGEIMYPSGSMGMIIPISAFANDSMKELQQLFKDEYNLYLSTFHQRPAQLFDGVLQRLSIFIATKKRGDNEFYTTGVLRWYSNTRAWLFQNLSFVKADQSRQQHFVKLGSELEVSIFEKYSSNNVIKHYLNPNASESNNIYYRTAGGGYWVTLLNKEFDCIAVSNKHSSFLPKVDSSVFCSALNSNLFWWYYTINYDLFNFKDYMIFGFQLTYPEKYLSEMAELSKKLEKMMRSNALYYGIKGKKTVTYQKEKSKPIIDQIDEVLAKHYGFTEEELDFIINYDIKYRMGNESDGED